MAKLKFKNARQTLQKAEEFLANSKKYAEAQRRREKS
jgi:hypothetical protein